MTPSMMNPQNVITHYLIHAPEQGDWDWEDHCDGLAGGIIVALEAHGFEITKNPPLKGHAQ